MSGGRERLGFQRVAAPIGSGQESGPVGAGWPGWVGVRVRVRCGVGEGPGALRCSLEGRDPGLGLGRG